MNEMETAAADGDVQFECPRCGAATDARFYGPCDACRAQLHTMFLGEAQAVEAEAYEPKMNVTPNAVALKD